MRGKGVRSNGMDDVYSDWQNQVVKTPDLAEIGTSLVMGQWPEFRGSERNHFALDIYLGQLGRFWLGFNWEDPLHALSVQPPGPLILKDSGKMFMESENQASFLVGFIALCSSGD